MPAKKPIAKKGLFMLHVGHGKGKTTAAFGMAIRAVGSGLNVFIVQFIKGEWPSGERDFLKFFNNLQNETKLARRSLGEVGKIGSIEVTAHGKGFVKILGDKKPFAVHQAAAREALELGRKALKSGKYQLVIMDEAISAVEAKLIKTKDLLELLKDKPPDVHLLMTGHDAPKALAAKADLVSEVNMIKHPYYKGVLAQRGIDY